VRPGAGAGSAGTGVAGAGRPGTAGGGVGGPNSGIGVRPGAGAGAAGAGGYGTRYTSNNALAARHSAVNANAFGYRSYNANFYGGYANAWHPANFAAASYYANPGYGALAATLGIAAVANPYDYGSNVVTQTNTVYVNGDATATPEQYSDQASQIATAGQEAAPADDTKWMPLGVFAICEGSATTSDDIFQLAVNPDGVIRGNYNNQRNDDVETITGSVDKSTQRAAWTIGSDQTPVYEAGLVNLTKDATPIMVHNGDGTSNQVTLVRLQEPADQGSASGATP